MWNPGCCVGNGLRRATWIVSYPALCRYMDLLWCTEQRDTNEQHGTGTDWRRWCADREACINAPDGGGGKAVWSRSHHQQHSWIRILHVQVSSPDQTLDMVTNETYSLAVRAPVSTLQSQSVFGALRGLETFMQLVWTATHAASGAHQTVGNCGGRAPWQNVAVGVGECIS